jgi:hypothetical protein
MSKHHKVTYIIKYLAHEFQFMHFVHVYRVMSMETAWREKDEPGCIEQVSSRHVPSICLSYPSSIITRNIIVVRGVVRPRKSPAALFPD